MVNSSEKYIKIGIIGLGYVGLPLARLFATQYPVVGFDINTGRIAELKAAKDVTLEISDEQLSSVLRPAPTMDSGLFCTHTEADLSDCNYYIVTVPTPVDATNRPNLDAVFKATESAGRLIREGDIIIYESTVYPGVTEEECVPILEQVSGLRYNTDFYVGYSPERVNPGDKEHTIDKILKVTSGSTPEIAGKIDALYKSVIAAGTYMAPSIRVAEAAKVIENSQRDINIAFVNELAKIFNLIGIDTHEVLKAARTKWNFLPFSPGLVGGHCIGVDPYYLAQKAQQHGYHPEIILSGRRMNDSMGNYVAGEVIKLMVHRDIPIRLSRVLVMGITFKENCPDVRNTRVVDIIRNLREYGCEVLIFDPWASPEDVEKELGLNIELEMPVGQFGAIILAVAHRKFLELDLRSRLQPEGILYDVKGILSCRTEGRL